MSDDLISRRATIEGIDGYFDFIIRLRKQRHTKMQEAIHLDVKSIIDDLPSIQPKTGRWIPHKAPFPIQSVYSCSKCNSSVPSNIFVVGCDFEFCPYCGAKMESEDVNND